MKFIQMNDIVCLRSEKNRKKTKKANKKADGKKLKRIKIERRNKYWRKIE